MAEMIVTAIFATAIVALALGALVLLVLKSEMPAPTLPPDTPRKQRKMTRRPR